MPTYCFACWKHGSEAMHVIRLRDVPAPPPNKRITTKSERRAIAIAKGTGAPLSQRKAKARRHAG
jgi:hypothetical protein